MNQRTETPDRYLFIRNLALLQKQADVERETGELLVAYAKLQTDKGNPVEFYRDGNDSVPWNFALDKLLQRNPDIDPRAQQFISAYSRAMHARRLPTIYTKRHLAARLNVTLKQLDWLAYSKTRYRTFHIPKADGEMRRMDEPVEKLKTVQHWILRRILNKLPNHPRAQGFCPGRSILTNARKHILRQIVVRIDIKDFFPSITKGQVRKVFQRAGYPYTVANILANLCTREEVLPIGAPSSPALANKVCRKLDNRFWLLSRERKFRYTRYADDLVFSSPNRQFSSLIPFLKQILAEEGFRVNERKLVIARRDGCQKVTGIVVNRRTNVPQEHYKWLRSVLHNCSAYGVASQLKPWSARMLDSGREPPVDVEQFGRQLAGRIAFVRSVHAEKGEALWGEFRKLEFG